MTYPRHIVIVSGLVRDEAGRILLVNAGSRGWALPGGEVGVGEDVITALKRGIYEQTGSRVAVARLSGVQSSAGFPPKLLLTFTAQHLGGEVAPAEGATLGYFAEAEVLTMVQDGAQLDTLIDGLSSLGVTYRKYTSRPYLVQLEAVI